jgi:hypothetical protein
MSSAILKAQRSPLLELPPELRLIIYEHLFADELILYYNPYRISTRPSPFVKHNQAAILSTCHLLYKEALPIAQSTRYVFQPKDEKFAWARYLKLQSALSRVKDITIRAWTPAHFAEQSGLSFDGRITALSNLLSSLDFCEHATQLRVYFHWEECGDTNKDFDQLIDVFRRVKCRGAIELAIVYFKVVESTEELYHGRSFAELVALLNAYL